MSYSGPSLNAIIREYLNSLLRLEIQQFNSLIIRRIPSLLYPMYLYCTRCSSGGGQQHLRLDQRFLRRDYSAGYDVSNDHP